jgi:hypothetical protein
MTTVPQPWPSTVNQNVMQQGYSETPERNVISFKPEVGRPILRRRTSLSQVLSTWTMWLSSAEWDTLLTFFQTTLSDGVTPFMFDSPRTGTTDTYLFEDVPKIVSTTALTYEVSFPVRKLVDEILFDPIGDGSTFDIGDGISGLRAN